MKIQQSFENLANIQSILNNNYFTLTQLFDVEFSKPHTWTHGVHAYGKSSKFKGTYCIYCTTNITGLILNKKFNKDFEDSHYILTPKDDGHLWLLRWEHRFSPAQWKDLGETREGPYVKGEEKTDVGFATFLSVNLVVNAAVAGRSKSNQNSAAQSKRASADRTSIYSCWVKWDCPNGMNQELKSIKSSYNLVNQDKAYGKSYKTFKRAILRGETIVTYHKKGKTSFAVYCNLFKVEGLSLNPCNSESVNLKKEIKKEKLASSLKQTCKSINGLRDKSLPLVNDCNKETEPTTEMEELMTSTERVHYYKALYKDSFFPQLDNIFYY